MRKGVLRNYAVISIEEGEGSERKAIDELVERRARKRAGRTPAIAGHRLKMAIARDR